MAYKASVSAEKIEREIQKIKEILSDREGK